MRFCCWIWPEACCVRVTVVSVCLPRRDNRLLYCRRLLTPQTVGHKCYAAVNALCVRPPASLLFSQWKRKHRWQLSSVMYLLLRGLKLSRPLVIETGCLVSLPPVTTMETSPPLHSVPAESPYSIIKERPSSSLVLLCFCSRHRCSPAPSPCSSPTRTRGSISACCCGSS